MLKNYFLLQGQGIEPGLPDQQLVLYELSYWSGRLAFVAASRTFHARSCQTALLGATMQIFSSDLL